ncbi:biotin/lipoate A/B protein ligase family protein [Halosolutus amylolyticus]|uniref:Biotin/lipoate A/B protein ligase family protein n=1 Tax=Halosolutus amylolyticus TaxID=2932267 RepID=A0ABD5PRV9_9EURY|nr:biotin/lipoate A/B protein ligase family protein [Halosolutus amylolyticus]
MTALADREWRLIRDDPREGALQMAIEEVAARTALEDGIRTVRVYDWDPSTLSLGYRQDADTVDWDYCDREGIDVTRRQTGGGGIYHDHRADISYSIVAPADEVPGDLMDCYALFCEPIIEAFERMGVDADFAAAEQDAIYHPSCYLRDIHPAHDVVAPAEEGANARKISGNAQYRQRDVVIQHGSISYDLEPAHHVGVFDTTVDESTFTNRVTSIREQAGIDREEAVETLADALSDWCDATESKWREDELAAARDLADRKFGADAWIRDREVLEASER